MSLRALLFTAALGVAALVVPTAASAFDHYGYGPRAPYGAQYGHGYRGHWMPWWARMGFHSEHAARHHMRKMREYHGHGYGGPRYGWADRY